MQNQKKNLWLIALAGALTIAFVGGCPGGDETTPTTPTAPPGTARNFEVHEWIEAKSLPNLLTSTTDVRLIEVSGDDKFVYATNDTAALSVADISAGIDNIAKDASWTPRTFVTAIPVPGPGKVAAAFNGAAAARIKRFHPTKNGVLISVDAGGAGAANGAAALLVGNAYKAAWQADNVAHTHLAVATPVDSRALYAGVLKRTNGDEYVYLALHSNTDTPGANSTLGTAIDAAGTSVAARLGLAFTRAANPFVTTAPLWFASAAGKAMILAVDRGLSEYANTDAEVGSATPIADAAGRGVVGGWKLAVGGAANAALIKDVVSLGDKVYIALDTGVAIYDAKTPANSPANIDATWTAGTNILHLAVDKLGKKVYAVMDDGLFDCTDGKKAAKKFLDGAKAKPADADIVEKGVYEVSSKLPGGSITDAKFTKGNLIIATSDKGLIIRKAAKAETVK